MILITWDHRQQPDWERIKAALRQFMQRQKHVYLEVVDTQDDQYAIVLDAAPIQPQKARARYESFLRSGA